MAQPPGQQRPTGCFASEGWLKMVGLPAAVKASPSQKRLTAFRFNP